MCIRDRPSGLTESPEGETLNGSQPAVVEKYFGREKVVERDACYPILSLKVVYRCMWLFMVNPNIYVRLATRPGQSQ